MVAISSYGMLRLFRVVIILFACAGCALTQMQKESETLGTAGYIKGRVIVESEQKGPVIVLRFREDKGVYRQEAQVYASSYGDYQFAVLPGTYYIAAYIDANNDGKYVPGEHANYYGKPTGIPVAARQTVKVENFVISGELVPPSTPVKVERSMSPIISNIGKVMTLRSIIFARDNYALGMWKPIDFFTKVGGGLLFLQNYEQGKVPVIFVHGINGGPHDFDQILERLDRDHYQPWVLYYPSGFRLDIISDYFVQAVIKVQQQYGFKQFVVIAHSMGGLVTRSFVKKYTERYPERTKNIGMAMTIDSPLGGMPSARLGVRNSPLVVQSWIDVAPDSQFLQDLLAWTWPKEIPYYLVFSYEDGDSSDGVVPLQNQIPLKLQMESVRTFGFNQTHVGILSDKEFIERFDSIMTRSAK